MAEKKDELPMDLMDILPEEKPTRKPDMKTQGRLFQWKDSDYKVFVPSKAKDQPSREIIKTSRGVTYYKNEGEKNNSYSVHCNVDGSVKDPAAELLQRVQEQLGPLCKKEPQINVANFIVDTPELKVWKRKKEKKLLLRIELDMKMSAGDMQTNLLKKMIEVNKLISSGELKS